MSHAEHVDFTSNRSEDKDRVVHKHNLVHNIAGGGGGWGANWPWVCGDLFYKGLKFDSGGIVSKKRKLFVVFLLFIFHLPLFNSVTKKKTISRLKKFWGRAFASPCPAPPKLRLWSRRPEFCVGVTRKKKYFRCRSARKRGIIDIRSNYAPSKSQLCCSVLFPELCAQTHAQCYKTVDIFPGFPKM
jgi:hypothetical protein